MFHFDLLRPSLSLLEFIFLNSTVLSGLMPGLTAMSECLSQQFDLATVSECQDKVPLISSGSLPRSPISRLYWCYLTLLSIAKGAH